MLNVIRIGWFFNHKQFEEFKKQSLRQPEIEIKNGKKKLEIKLTELKRGRKFNVEARKREVNKGESGDQGEIVPYEESSGYGRDTYV